MDKKFLCSVWGNDFSTVIPYRALYIDSKTEVTGFDLQACTDLHVHVVKLNDMGEMVRTFDLARFGSYEVITGNALRIDWVGPKLQLGIFSVEFIAKWQGRNIRSYTPTKVLIGIVATNEEAYVPEGALIENSTYLLDADLLLMLSGGVQSDWAQDDSSYPDYIKNKPGVGTGLSENNFSDSDKEKLDGLNFVPLTNLELNELLK